ncbi:MAG TPA: N-acetylglucosamine 6-phosphate deacetylase, partial [Acidimicrobiia bacterium]|nr:N-acetylglucosamine 6-phosphate deacetylase [Acidimicrobiia bacterium]
TTGLIADGVHVAPDLLRLAFLTMGAGRIALVTDATSALGTGPGTHRLGDTELSIQGLEVRGPDGQLAGSAAPIAHALGPMRRLGCGWADLTAMTSATPARIVGYVPDPGDRVLLDDDLGVAATAIAGEVVYRRAGS